ncbi:MAG: galactokinase, partial [Ruminococcus sp.]|nr:galactokinase [Ruminococcus sp.]
TDHQHGCALAAAVNLDAVAVVAFHEEGVIRVQSEGYGMSAVDLSDLSVHEEEKGKSIGIIRGIAARFDEMGVKIGGFDAYSVSDVLSGSGLSSSAAFETLIGTILDVHYNSCKAGEIEIAKIGQYAENVYFGKGSGLLDQMVCSVGGFVFIDFNDTENPKVEKHHFDFDAAGYNLCITDTKGSHSDLTDDYVAVPSEMKSVAAYFGKNVLREVDEKEFFAAIPDLHGKVNDRAILRAIHFFGENSRAILEADALERGDLERFFTIYRRSAASSANLLQNLYSTSKPTEQGIPLAIAVSRLVLGEFGAVRVHGGGFAGTIQAFVPMDKTADYAEKMNALFGEGSCYVLRIRPVGGIEII